MKKLLLYIFILAEINLTNDCMAQEKLSLEDIIARIDTVYPEVLMYDLKVQAIRSLGEGSNSWMPPIFSVGADRFPYDFSMLDSKDDPMNQAAIMFSLEQMIPNPGKQKAKRNYINSLASIQQNTGNWKKNQLGSTAKLLYNQRLISEKKLYVLNENLQVLNLLIQTAEVRYKYNQTDLSTIYKAQAKISDLRNMQYMLQSQIAESNIGLNTLMSRDANTIFAIDTNVTLKDYPTTILNDTSQYLRSDIQSMENTITSMTLNQKYMSSAKKPDFGFKLQHMQMYGMPNQFSVMGMITIPIVPWSSKMYKSEVNSMNFEIKAMQQQKAAMQLMTRRMITEKLNMLQFERKQLLNYESEIIPSYQKNFETSLLAYKQANGSFFILIDAWEMTLMKRMEYLDKLQNVLTMQTEYEFETEQK
jgi:outer membrane protein, heavy metal efflux system